jgi:AbrB family looped-hinge helix DNA binding protein
LRCERNRAGRKMTKINIMSLLLFLVYSKNMSKLEASTRARINENGRIVIPFRIRRAMGLEPGDTVVIALEDGVLRMEPHRAKVRKVQEELKRFAKPGARASDELAEGRLEESRIEMEEWLG